MSSINSLGIKLGNSNCRLASAIVTDYGNVFVNNLTGIDEQFATKTMFTLMGNEQYQEGFEHYLAGKEESDPGNIVFDALLPQSSNPLAAANFYVDPEIGNIFAEKDPENRNYDLKFYDENNPSNWKNAKFSDIEVIAGILGKILDLAKGQMPEKGEELRQIVITIPSMAGYDYRQKLINATKILDLPPNIHVQLVAQMTAAAIAYRHKEGDAIQQGHVLFFYMGARNMELAIYKFLDGQSPICCHLDGIVGFGGENFTAKMVEDKMDFLRREFDLDWSEMENREKRTIWRNVRLAMEKIKSTLGALETATRKVDLGSKLEWQQIEMSRHKFEEICHKECQKVESFLEEKFSKFAGMEIKRVVLAGNSSKLYLIHKLLRKYCTEGMLVTALPPELAVVHGAAIKALANAFCKGNCNFILPTCLNRVLVPSITFRGIYGKKRSSDLPLYLLKNGIEILIDNFAKYKWSEEEKDNFVGENDQQLMISIPTSANSLLVGIDENGLFQFRYKNDESLVMENAPPELEEAKKRFVAYKLDVLKVKREAEEWEEERRKLRRTKSLRICLENKTKNKEENMELVGKEKMGRNTSTKENRENKMKIRSAKMVNKNGKNNEQNKRQSAADENIEEEEEEESVEIIDPEIIPLKMSSKADQNEQRLYGNVLFEYKYNRENVGIELYGSWDNWTKMTLMKYSPLTSSYIGIVEIEPSKNEFEFNFVRTKGNYLFVSRDYRQQNSRNKQRIHYQVNVFSFTQNSIKNGSTKADNGENILGGILKLDKAMNQMKKKLTKKRLFTSFFGKILDKYFEIRSASKKPLVANNLEQMKELVDRAKTYLNLIFAFVEFEKKIPSSKKSKDVNLILNAFKGKLVKFAMSKEEIISNFKKNFMEPIVNECRRMRTEEKIVKQLIQIGDIEMARK